MTSRSHIRCIRLYPLAIPLRRKFSHAGHVRHEADPLVVQIELADGTLGFGETLPRPYVSGETVESAISWIRREMLDALASYHPRHFPEALERIEALPTHDTEGRVVTAARAGVELALLDAYSRHFGKPISEAVGWYGLPGFGSPGSLRSVRYSGVLGGDETRRLRRSVRLMRLYGLRDFKLKVGYPDDPDRIRLVARALGRGLGRKLTLRLDANGAWTLDRACEVLEAVKDVPIRCVEQPLARDDDAGFVTLKERAGVAIIPDESLATLDDAERLYGIGALDGLNIRLSKNGGFLPALRLAHLARRHSLLLQLGCMVGETSILSAVGRRFIENVPGITFAEGSYGRRLLRDDVVRRPIQFGYGGRPQPLPGPGWGVEVDPERLKWHVRPGMLEFPL